jgi:hypothetical protein
MRDVSGVLVVQAILDASTDVEGRRATTEQVGQVGAD